MDSNAAIDASSAAETRAAAGDIGAGAAAAGRATGAGGGDIDAGVGIAGRGADAAGVTGNGPG